MSRLVDRIQTNGCVPIRLSQIAPLDPEEVGRSYLDKAASRASSVPSSLGSSAREIGESILRDLPDATPAAMEAFTADDFRALPVIAADEVAEYVSGFSIGTDMAEVWSSLAPPFDRFFVEAQTKYQIEYGGVAPYAWGTVFSSVPPDSYRQMIPEKADDVVWCLQAELVLELNKGRPLGPAARYWLLLDSAGLVMRHDDGAPVIAGGPPAMSSEPPPNAKKEWADSLAPFLFTTLLTVSFVHCRNVSLREVKAGAERRSKKRRSSRPPRRTYHVLDIEPMKRILEAEGRVSSNGLGKALHIVRGHFKTYTEEAPLLGRHTGQFWFPSHLRGRASEGRVDKDYSVRLSVGFGGPYRAANEEQRQPPQSTDQSDDPDKAGEGAVIHAAVQNRAASVLEELGLHPRSPKPSEPPYDLGWESRGSLWVAEVKSTTPANEERQLRLAVGQVLRYAQVLTEDTGHPTQPLIILDGPPSSPGWQALCAQHGIILASPDTLVAEIDNPPAEG